jgi:hypothetical protein
MRNIILACLLVAAGTQTAHAKPQNMNLLLENNSFEYIDLGQTGPTKGDITVSGGLIFNAKNKEKIGTYITRRIVLSVDIPGGDNVTDALIEYKLPGGSVTVSGITTTHPGTHFPNKDSERPIVGGTGKYFGVRGTSKVTPMAGQPNMFLTNLKFK